MKKHAIAGFAGDGNDFRKRRILAGVGLAEKVKGGRLVERPCSRVSVPPCTPES